MMRGGSSLVMRGGSTLGRIDRFPLRLVKLTYQLLRAYFFIKENEIILSKMAIRFSG